MYETCPDCGHQDVAITLEEHGTILYECGRCDWYFSGTKPFHLGAWSVQVHQALAPIDILQALLMDPDGVSFLRPRLRGVSYLAHPILPSAGNWVSDEYIRGEMDIAQQVYLRQMIVLAVSYIELILKDFFGCLFRAHPLRMNAVLPPKESKTATVSLTEIVNASSKDALLGGLASRAAGYKASGDIDKTLRELTSDCRIQLCHPFIEDLRELKELRNRIVHDDTDEQVTIAKVHGSFGLVLYLLYTLSQVADAYKVPCWDEIGFVEDFRAKLNAAE